MNKVSFDTQGSTSKNSLKTNEIFNLKSTIKNLEKQIDEMKNSKEIQEISIENFSRKGEELKNNCVNTESKYVENFKESHEFDNSQINFINSSCDNSGIEYNKENLQKIHNNNKNYSFPKNNKKIEEMENEILRLKKENLSVHKKKEKIKEKFKILKDKIFNQANKLTDEVNKIRKETELKLTKFIQNYSKFLKDMVYTSSKVITFISNFFI